MSGGIVWLASYPKSGSTWMRVLLQNLEADGAERPADINRLSFGMVASSRAWLDEMLGLATADLTEDEIEALRPDAYDWAWPAGDPPFYLKIHDAYRVLGSGVPLIGRRAPRRALYMVRNPLDLVLSYANHLGRSIDDTIAVMADPDHCLAASDVALRRQVRQRLGTWSKHITSWLDAPDLALHLVRYEQVLGEPVETFGEAVRFLGWTSDHAALQRAVDLSGFARLQQQEATTGFDERPPGMAVFFRSGRSGEWREQLSPVQVEQVILAHGAVMQRLGYLDADGRPV